MMRIGWLLVSVALVACKRAPAAKGTAADGGAPPVIALPVASFSFPYADCDG
jgi:hypothetical protein